MQHELHRIRITASPPLSMRPGRRGAQGRGHDQALDYGAASLGKTLEEIFKRPLKIHHYDPAMPEWSEPPAPCNFVACIDVLEHIEPDLLDNVLDDLKRVTAGRRRLHGAHRRRGEGPRATAATRT